MKRLVERYAPIAIIGGALLVVVPRLAAAFAFVEPSFFGLPTVLVTGPGYGLATAGATLYTWHVYQQRKRLKLAWLLLVGWLLLLIIIAVILVPGMVVQLRSGPLAVLLPPPLDFAWCAIVAVSSELVVALAALATAMSKEASTKAKVERTEPAKAAARSNGHKRLVCPFCGTDRNASGEPFATQNALNAHSGRCSDREREASYEDTLLS